MPGNHNYLEIRSLISRFSDAKAANFEHGCLDLINNKIILIYPALSQYVYNYPKLFSSQYIKVDYISLQHFCLHVFLGAVGASWLSSNKLQFLIEVTKAGAYSAAKSEGYWLQTSVAEEGSASTERHTLR